MIEEDIRKNLQNKGSDHIYAAAKTGLSFIPVVGGAISEVFNLIITEPLSKRRDEWLIKLYDELKQLEEKIESFDIENLKDNDLFISIALKASQMVLKNHQEEKKEALCNAVINTATNITIEENEQIIFLNYIDELTVWHIRLLQYLNDPNGKFDDKALSKEKYYMGGPITPLLDYFPELDDREDFIKIIVKDLFNKNLITIDGLNTMMTKDGMFASRTSPFGKKFIRYITTNL